MPALDLSGRELRSLAGLALPPDLAQLDLAQNELTSLEGLPPLPALRELIVNRNRLRSLAGLGAAPALERLSCSFNPLEGLAPLAACPRLEALYARSVPFATLAPLAALPLHTLALTVYAPADLAPLHAHALAELHLSGAGLRALPALRWAGVRVLSLTHAPALTELEALAAATALVRLSLAFTGVEDVAPLAGLSALAELDLRGTPAAARPLPAWTRRLRLKLR